MKTALITGGSSGIGYELSRLFARDHYRLIWVAKPEAELQAAKERLTTEFKELEVHYLALDLSVVGAAQEVYDWAKNQWQIDVLVNNAGFGTFGYLQDISMEKELAMLNLNILTVYQLSRFFLEDMLKRNEGRILNVSSNTSLQPVPKMATYAATKAFVKHFSESVSEELKERKSKVSLTTVCPAAIRNTQFQAAANMEKVRTFNSILTTTAEEVAKDAYQGMLKGKSLVLSGTRLRASTFLMKFVPQFIIKAVLKRELERM